MVLVPLGSPEDGVAELVFGQVALGRLDAHVLDGIGVDFWANQRLDDVEQVGVGEGAEDGRPGPEGGVGLDVLKGQREVEVLAVDAAGFNADLDVAVAKLELFVARGDFALSVERVGQAVEDRGVFVDDRVEGGDRIEDALDDDVAFASKVIELVGCERGHCFSSGGCAVGGRRVCCL